jgi:hypothetical protein
MGHRHPGFDRRRRLTGALLGGATVLTLFVAVLFLEQGRGAGPDTTLAAGDTTTTVLSTATSPSSVVTSPPLPNDTTPGTLAPTTSPTPPPASAPTSLATSTSPTTAPETTLVETTSPETTVPETTVATLSRLILESDGLAVVDFGQGVSETVEAVQARLGPATSDSGWVAARGEYGVCPGTAVRVIRWESLRLYFTDGPTDFGEETRHFFYYNQSTVSAEVVIDLTTSAGIGLDSTVDELRRAYADRLVVESSIPFGVTFYIEANTPGLLSGILTSSSPDGSVTAISGGFGCGS